MALSCQTVNPPKVTAQDKECVITRNENGLVDAQRQHPSIIDIIRKKRDGQELSADDIEWFVTAACKKLITDAQIGALLMAVCLKGMTDAETFALTEAMILSGSRLEYPGSWKGNVVGKHSTGGVGDKVTLVLVPALACCGLKVPKMSGRGLGFTGGTLDKMESIPGYSVYRSKEDIVEIVDKIGCCIVGQTTDLTPADKLLYAIRDTTATTESVPLIAASIMSKKAAENLDALCLEVTFGKAAFVKTKQEAERLARVMLETGRNLGIRTTALLIQMDNVLGRTVGNSLEIVEAVQCLRSGGSAEVVRVVCTIGGYLLWKTGKADNPDQGYSMIETSLKDGSAAAKFQAMIQAQGVSRATAQELMHGDIRKALPQAAFVTKMRCRQSGFVKAVDAYACAVVTHSLGAGRISPQDTIDYSAGIQLLVSIGSRVTEGDAWAEVHHNVNPLPDSTLSMLEDALVISQTEVSPENVIADVME